MTPNVTGLRTDEQLADFLERHKGDTVSAGAQKQLKPFVSHFG